MSKSTTVPKKSFRIDDLLSRKSVGASQNHHHHDHHHSDDQVSTSPEMEMSSSHENYGESSLLKNSHRHHHHNHHHQHHQHLHRNSSGEISDGETTPPNHQDHHHNDAMLLHPFHPNQIMKYQTEEIRRLSRENSSDPVRNVMSEIRKQELMFRYNLNANNSNTNNNNNSSRMATGSSSSSGGGVGGGGIPVFSPEQLTAAAAAAAATTTATIPFSSFGPLSQYREVLQRSNELVTSVPIQFPFYNAHPHHHHHPGLPPISAFRSICPTDSMSTDDLDLARSFRHQASSLYEASLAYLGGNQSSFSMSSLLNGSGSKRKGGQIRFTNYQTSHLEKSFIEHKYLNANDRKKLANSLGLSDRQVKTWFQNRRAKWRKTKIDKNCTDIEGDLSRSSFNGERQSYSPDTGNCDSSASGLDAEEHSP